MALKKIFSLILLLGLAITPINADILCFKGEKNKPVVLSLTEINQVSSEVVTIKPYKVETDGLKSELEYYRWIYIPNSIFQVAVLIVAYSYMR